MENKIWGYRRENGRVGIRNHVVIMPVDDISNAAAEAVAKIVPGTLAIPHAYGRLQYGPDLDLFFKTIIGNCSNPNVAAVVVIGIEPNWTNRIVEEVQKTGKPVAGFSIERYGDLSTIEKAARTAQKFLQDASEIRREPVELSEILVSIKCGESDTTTGLGSCPTVGNVVDRLIDEGGTVLFGETSELTGGEHLIAERCATPEVKQKFLSLYQNYVEEIASKGVDLLGSQPTEGNIRGGLTTIEEKALGNIEKTGTKPVVDALGPAEAPVKAGLNFMDTSSAAAECITLMAAGGAVVHFFPTGQGNIIGHPIVPVIKLSANPITVSTMSEHIDVDVTGLLKREYNLQQAGDLLLDILIRTINGRLTAAETLGHREFVLTKLYRSA
ncbi:MAG: D-galactarate dehydratase [Bacillaceae bacterium]|jgi:(2R)-sulfolactate sulfo-lyase subunit beta|uniref:UxaA family hydrolase n=1 Tax=Aeribacillus TaxID=1055323 RepID=UPI0007B4CE85|nr:MULTISPECIES: UxaA family hydrolase [Aeribacillus]REJ12174.1 MAG: D-galactarate dehydratase [Bacillaceae bacterium]KZM56111.1 D-galactarate dehydratase [Aeribacillus pallidus]MDR9794113.1 UxaA family hydrolase [Aeribacillus pallidus]MDR9797139.1 UxaA family hydrolase [Aeribacillus pallidus]MED0651551.1 UxaA family hydrolase [Aeribacillus composti]